MANAGLNLTLILLNVLTYLTSAYNICETCDCAIREESSDVRAVRKFTPGCNEGTFKWFNLYGGAVRINFAPIFTGPFQLCFVVEMENTRIQVSQELSQKPMTRRVIGRPPTLKPIVSANERTDEICIPSYGESIHLFFESERTVKSVGSNFVKIYYVMEKRNDALFFDPLEECRPCTDIELIDAYCSHDIVLAGSMADVRTLGNQTNIDIQISDTIRKRRFYWEPIEKVPSLTETMTRHKKCQVGKGPGTFLFTGKRRLGTLKLTCSPYLNDWNIVARQAMQSGSMKCPLK